MMAKPATGKTEDMNGPPSVFTLRVSGLRTWNGRAGNSHYGAAGAQFRVLGMGGISGGLGRSVVIDSIAIADRGELGHRPFPFSVHRVLAET